MSEQWVLELLINLGDMPHAPAHIIEALLKRKVTVGSIKMKTAGPCEADILVTFSEKKDAQKAQRSLTKKFVFLKGANMIRRDTSCCGEDDSLNSSDRSWDTYIPI